MQELWQEGAAWLLINRQAVSILAAEGDKGGVTIVTKKAGQPQKPLGASHKTTFGGNKTSRK